MRQALGTLPWVEQESIQMDFKTRELKFSVKGKTMFDEEAVKKALKANGFPDVTVASPPS